MYGVCVYVQLSNSICLCAFRVKMFVRAHERFGSSLVNFDVLVAVRLDRRYNSGDVTAVAVVLGS